MLERAAQSLSVSTPTVSSLAHRHKTSVNRMKFDKCYLRVNWIKERESCADISLIPSSRLMGIQWQDGDKTIGDGSGCRRCHRNDDININLPWGSTPDFLLALPSPEVSTNQCMFGSRIPGRAHTSVDLCTTCLGAEHPPSSYL